MQRKRRNIKVYTIQSLTGLDKQDRTSRNPLFQPKNKSTCEFSIQNTLNVSLNQKAVDIIEQLQKELITNYHEDIAKQIGTWINSYKKQKNKQFSISFSPHTLHLIDTPQDEQRIPRVIESTKKLILLAESLSCQPDELESKVLELIEKQFLQIYTKIENAFDEEATVDNSSQNTYIHLKGRRAFNLLQEFCNTFTENEPIYKILALSKSESFQTLQKLNKYTKVFILKEEDNDNAHKILSDLNMEKINIFLTLIDRITSNLETITKNFKNQSSALESVLKNIHSSQMIQPFYDAKIDYNAAPEEATSSISMSKNTFMFSDRNGKKIPIVQGNFNNNDENKEGQSMVIEESDEDCDDEEDYEHYNNENNLGQNLNRLSRHNKMQFQQASKKNEKQNEDSNQDQFSFQIEYLKPGNIPWDLQTIRSEGKIGSGGQGTVFRAFDPKKERQIALKFTNLPFNWEKFKDRYLEEIRIQSYMTSKKMSHILEVDNKIYIYQDKYGQQQKYLISLMELGVGSLEDFIKICAQENKIISDRHIFHIFFDILQGLQQMHTLNYAHKDIKPQNIIYSIKDKCWKIADFGCIQVIQNGTGGEKNGEISSEHSSNLKKNNSQNSSDPGSPKNNIQNYTNRFAQECYVTGTPTYMSPELYSLYQQRQEVGLVNLVANDFYSLGITILKLRELEKIERTKLNEKIMINRLSSDKLSNLITMLLNEDQVFRSSLSFNSFTEMFFNEYQDYIKTQKDEEFNYLETVFKYDENAQDNLNLAQKLECAKTYQNINLREKCLRYFEEIVSDPEFEKLDIFEKRNILVEQVQALSYFGDYERAYEQGMKCLNISSEQLKGFHSNEFVISDLKNIGQILFNQGQYDLALQKYLLVLDIIAEDQEKKQQLDLEFRNSQNLYLKKQSEQINQIKRTPSAKRATQSGNIERKSTFHKSKIIQKENQSEILNHVEFCESDKDGNQEKELSNSDKVLENLNTNHNEEIMNLANAEHHDQKDINQDNKQNNFSDIVSSNNQSFQIDQNGSKIPQNNKIQILISSNSLAEFQNDSVLTNSNGKNSQNEIQRSSQFDNSIDQNRQASFSEFNSKNKQHADNLLSSNSQNSKLNSDYCIDKDEDIKADQKNHVSLLGHKEIQNTILDTIQESSYNNSIQNTFKPETPSQTTSGQTRDFTSFTTSTTNNLKFESNFHSKNVIKQAMEYDNSLGKFNQEHVSQEIQNDLAQIQTLIGQALNKLGHYDKALKYYEEALKTTEKNLGKNDIQVAIILDSMGESLVNNGRYKESFRIFKRSYKIKRNEYGRNSIHLAETIAQMGKVLEKLTLYEKSAQHYSKALQIFEQHYGQNHIKTAEILNHLGNVKRAEGNYKQAYQLYLEVLTIMKNHYPSDHIEIGKIYHDIGNVLRNQENHELSLDYFLKAEEIKIKYYGTDHVEVSNTRQYIGIIYRKMEKLDLAQKYFELALAPMENHFGKEHIEVVKLVQEIAVLLQLQGHLQLAKEKLEFVLNNRIKEFGNFHIKTANTMQNVATIEMELCNYLKSLEYTQTVLTVRKQTFGENHIKVANSITSIAQLQDLIGDYQNAQSSLDNAIQIYNLDLVTNKGKILQANIIRATILYNTLQLKEAQNLLEKELIPNIKPSSVNYQQAYTLLGYIYQQQYLIFEDSNNDTQWLLRHFRDQISDGSPRDYITIFSNLSQIIQNILIESEKTYGKDHISYANVLEQNGLFNLNVEQVEAAIQIKLKRYEASHKEILNSKQLICQIEYLKSRQENNPFEQDPDKCKRIVENLKEILEQKQQFYQDNPNHTQLFNSLLLLYKITKENNYRERILSLINQNQIQINQKPDNSQQSIVI
ncbi:tetratricopeptide repeat protein (macronuclear) [Tetrahymena thermophila SB210]|uniref:Tetratricopeptide repeat protein n=1 Tax=Tetrahymena thermophila (strain SB210) TaxID=312017 RepID=Q23K57_TETTS|nr:tetratricopeptide repeat protein [Tetrahymena thermophila SB210]EAR96986.2 tetratricopeptide repeat protein [Tetrahymena thermophila SB210]|eukprot:XP_001017231.2 tetratricopeptide repeat protein [Tetrahymena thermophila SB210]